VIHEQFTLLEPITFEGIGLHSGQNVQMRLVPGAERQGIQFYRTDKDQVIPLDLKNVSYTNRQTGLTAQGVSVKTVEHVLSAIHAHGITDVTLELSGEECPILDGSAKSFSNAIRQATKKKVSNNASTVYSDEEFVKFAYNDGVSHFTWWPAEPYDLSVLLKRPHTPIDGLSYQLRDLSQYDEDIAWARTYVLYTDLLKLAEVGLVQGGQLHTASVVFDREPQLEETKRLLTLMGLPDDYVWDKDQLVIRSDDEPARHKILDLLGDLKALNAAWTGKLFCVNPGHAANMAFCKFLVEQGYVRYE